MRARFRALWPLRTEPRCGACSFRGGSHSRELEGGYQAALPHVLINPRTIDHHALFIHPALPEQGRIAPAMVTQR